jgi:hypothetical protein
VRDGRWSGDDACTWEQALVSLLIGALAGNREIGPALG